MHGDNLELQLESSDWSECDTLIHLDFNATCAVVLFWLEEVIQCLDAVCTAQPHKHTLLYDTSCTQPSLYRCVTTWPLNNISSFLGNIMIHRILFCIFLHIYVSYFLGVRRYIKKWKFLWNNLLNGGILNSSDVLPLQKDRIVRINSLLFLLPAHIVNHLCSSCEIIHGFYMELYDIYGIRVSPDTYSNTVGFLFSFSHVGECVKY